MSEALFPDRETAGRKLAARFVGRSLERPIVYALPRGGAPVAAPIAAALDAPLALLWVRKIGTPFSSELAAGCVAEGDPPAFVWNADVLELADMDVEAQHHAAERALNELAARKARFPPTLPPSAVRGRSAIVVDDGVATGASMRAAIVALRRHAPAAVIVATPVAAPDVVVDLAQLADEVVCLAAPVHLGSVGRAYANFLQVENQELEAILARAPRPQS